MKTVTAVITAIACASLIGNTPPAASEQRPTAKGTDVKRPDVPAMTVADIRRFNTTVPANHRYYIVCRKYAVTGSLAKVRKICQTRDDWNREINEVRQSAQTLIDGGRASSGCDPYCFKTAGPSGP